MSKNITYLLGAGASANCLPVINELPERIDTFIKFLNHGKGFVLNQLVTVKAFDEENIKALIADLEWLKIEIRSHQTVDTLAKKFYLIKEKDDDLVKLKKLLIVYFLFEQTLNTAFIRGNQPKELPDKRYDSLIATLINNKRGDLTLSPNFKVITWNYDIQFELAYREYQSKYGADGLQKALQIIPTKSYIHSDSILDFSKFSIVRLNGVAGLTSFEPFEDYNANLPANKAVRNEAKTATIITMLANKYASSLSEDVEAFNYAWESGEDYDKLHRRKKTLVDEAYKIMRQTDVLVIIGYSFPSFNRSIDKNLINSLNKDFDMIYIQDTPDRVFELRKNFIDSFTGLTNYTASGFEQKVKEVTSINQFFVPPQADI
jgi:hypothetical protein